VECDLRSLPQPGVVGSEGTDWPAPTSRQAGKTSGASDEVGQTRHWGQRRGALGLAGAGSLSHFSVVVRGASWC
jgi:hypothetical protein